MFCLVLEFRKEKRTFTKIEGGNIDFFLLSSLMSFLLGSFGTSVPYLWFLIIQTKQRNFGSIILWVLMNDPYNRWLCPMTNNAMIKDSTFMLVFFGWGVNPGYWSIFVCNGWSVKGTRNCISEHNCAFFCHTFHLSFMLH